ncbi:MAG: galactose mutarotase [Melioribacteraceae bacterium]|nr:galactose mutarotase [Melioribacteraceae bacterium]
MNCNLLFLLILCLSFTMNQGSMAQNNLTLEKFEYGTTNNNEIIDGFTLKNSKGISVSIITFGATVISIKMPDADGNVEDITLGYKDLIGYENDNSYFGATVGRYANRIAKGKFILDGVEYQLSTNDNGNHLHGGNKGFNKVVWKAEPFERENEIGVKLEYLSEDGEEGYPGNMKATVTYSLNNDSELKIYYEAETDKKTIVNLTHHSYYNLSGNAKRNILNHYLTIYADKYTPVDNTLIPTGEIMEVERTPFNFLKAKKIGAEINKVPGGYDHNFVLIDSGENMRKAAELYDEKSGRKLELFTTEQGVQFYSGNFLDGTIVGREGVTYEKYFGLCLEPQKFPDSPNKSNFTDAVLDSGEIYQHTTVIRLSVEK